MLMTVGKPAILFRNKCENLLKLPCGSKKGLKNPFTLPKKQEGTTAPKEDNTRVDLLLQLLLCTFNCLWNKGGGAGRSSIKASPAEGEGPGSGNVRKAPPECGPAELWESVPRSAMLWGPVAGEAEGWAFAGNVTPPVRLAPASILSFKRNNPKKCNVYLTTGVKTGRKQFCCDKKSPEVFSLSLV